MDGFASVTTKSDSLYFISTFLVYIGNVARSTTSRLNAESSSPSKQFRSVKEVHPTMCEGRVHSVSKCQAPFRASGGILQI